jgi:hypothetical protein
LTTTVPSWRRRSHQLAASAYRLPSSTLPQAARALRVLWDKLLNPRIAMKFKITNTDDCPLCHSTGSLQHILLHCTHGSLCDSRRHAVRSLIHHVSTLSSSIRTYIRFALSLIRNHDEGWLLLLGHWTPATRHTFLAQLPTSTKLYPLLSSTLLKLHRLIAPHVLNLTTIYTSLRPPRRNLHQLPHPARQTRLHHLRLHRPILRPSRPHPPTRQPHLPQAPQALITRFFPRLPRPSPTADHAVHTHPPTMT